jgi:hypothetical protein
MAPLRASAGLPVMLVPCRVRLPFPEVVIGLPTVNVNVPLVAFPAMKEVVDAPGEVTETVAPLAIVKLLAAVTVNAPAVELFEKAVAAPGRISWMEVIVTPPDVELLAIAASRLMSATPAVVVKLMLPVALLLVIVAPNACVIVPTLENVIPGAPPGPLRTGALIAVVDPEVQLIVLTAELLVMAPLIASAPCEAALKLPVAVVVKVIGPPMVMAPPLGVVIKERAPLVAVMTFPAVVVMSPVVGVWNVKVPEELWLIGPLMLKAGDPLRAAPLRVSEPAPEVARLPETVTSPFTAWIVPLPLAP